MIGGKGTCLLLRLLRRGRTRDWHYGASFEQTESTSNSVCSAHSVAYEHPKMKVTDILSSRDADSPYYTFEVRSNGKGLRRSDLPQHPPLPSDHPS